MVYTHILVSTPFPGVMLSLSLLRGGWHGKLSAFGVLHQEEHHVHVDGFTSLGILLICLLTCFHTSLFLHWSAAQCYIQPYFIWHLFSMLVTISLFFFPSPGLHFFDQPWLSSLQPWGLQCQPLPHLTVELCLVPPLPKAAISPTCVSVRDIVTVESSNHGGTPYKDRTKENKLAVDTW